MRNLKNPTGQVARWLQVLGTYNIKVIHRNGIKHTNADALSRSPCRACKRQEDLNQCEDLEIDEEKDNQIKSNPVELHFSPEIDRGIADNLVEHPNSNRIENDPDGNLAVLQHTDEAEKAVARAITRHGYTEQQNQMKDRQMTLKDWDPSNIRQEQMTDENVGILMAALENGNERPSWETVSSKTSKLKTLWSQWDRLELHGGMMYRRWESEEGKESKLQLILPDNCYKKQEVLQQFHDCPTAGHLGVEKTLEKVKQSFYWPGMKDQIQEYCRHCDKCFARKPKSYKNRAPLGSYQVGEPMERIEVDILGPLPLSKHGNRYILVVTDMFTKWTEAMALQNQEASTVSRALVDNFICRFGTPLQLHSDQGRNFESELFKELCSYLGIDKTRTTSFRPQSNGGVERFNRTLSSMLTVYCEKNQSTWDDFLPLVMMAYRSSIHKTTSKTPNSMLFGREITLPLQAVIGKPVDPDSDQEFLQSDDYLEHLKKKLKENHDIARRHLKKSAIYQKRRYDLKAKKQTLRKGQAVWAYEPARKIGICTKLTSRWKGPFIVEKRIDDVTYRIKKSARQPSKIYHVDRLAPYQGRNIPNWAIRFRRNQLEHCIQEDDKTVSDIDDEKQQPKSVVMDN